MHTKLTRINLSLPPEVVSVLDRIGKVTGAGRATLIREWLIEGLPAFEGIASALEMAADKNLDAFKLLEDTVRQTVAEAQQAGLDLRVPRRAARRKRNLKPKDTES